MSSTIFQLSTEPIAPEDRITDSDLPEYFRYTIADYYNYDTDRAGNLEAFRIAMQRVVEFSDDDESFTFVENGRQKYFLRAYETFLEQARILSGISLEAFAGETPFDIGMAMYRLGVAYIDKFGFYVYIDDNLMPMDEWIREYDLSDRYYIGGIIDYHS